MKKVILVTGARGFLGRNLGVAFRRSGFEVLEFTRSDPAGSLPKLAAQADLVFHLAGVNRPKDEEEFAEGNIAFTRYLCESLSKANRQTPLVFTSSIQAELDNPYGRSKKSAEDTVLDYHNATGAPVYIYRFPNIFGKWSHADYNTVVATYCHNISRGLPVTISNRAQPLRFVYVDEIVSTFLKIAKRREHDPATTRYEFQPVYPITLGELHDLIVSFHNDRSKCLIPDLSNRLTKYLYSTYVAFNDIRQLAFPVDLKTDDRGWLFELIKSPYSGQIFVSRTRAGITRGNHYHDSKVEKFCVIQGEGIIRFRHILDHEIIEYPVNDRTIRVVDIPPGYTHSIENVGKGDMITLFWANEIFDPEKPDTHFAKVMAEESAGANKK